MADRIKNYQQEADQITTLKEIRTDLGVTPSSYTPDATVVTKDRVVTFAQAEEELAVLGDIEKGVKQQVVKGDIADKRISNIEKLLQGNLYDYDTDDDTAYTKSVPSGAMPYAGLEQIGGKTVVWNQLVDSGTTTVPTISGHKYYTLIDGTASIVTADGTAITIVDDTADMVCDLTLMFGSGNEPSTTADFTAIFGATHYSYNAGTLLSAGVTSVKSGNINLLNTERTEVSAPGITSADTQRILNEEQVWVGFGYTGTTTVATTITSYTLGVGSVNFKSTANGVGVGFPVKALPSKQYTLKVSKNNPYRVSVLEYTSDGYYITGVTDASNYNSTITVTTTNNTKWLMVVLSSTTYTTNIPLTASNMQLEYGASASTYKPYFGSEFPIPAEVQALEGYGWSAGTAYNYIDYERKVFVQNVGAVDLGSLTWTYSANWGGYPRFESSHLTPSPYPRGDYAINNILTARYVTYSRNGLYATSLNGIALTFAGGTDYAITARDSDYSDADLFKASLSGQYFYYELAAPIETDISAYLTDDNLINVEAGGTLTFPNSNGDDYQIPVPSEEEYMINLQEAINNG